MIIYKLAGSNTVYAGCRNGRKQLKGVACYGCVATKNRPRARREYLSSFHQPVAVLAVLAGLLVLSGVFYAFSGLATTGFAASRGSTGGASVDGVLESANVPLALLSSADGDYAALDSSSPLQFSFSVPASKLLLTSRRFSLEFSALLQGSGTASVEVFTGDGFKTACAGAVLSESLAEASCDLTPLLSPDGSIPSLVTVRLSVTRVARVDRAALKAIIIK